MKNIPLILCSILTYSLQPVTTEKNINYIDINNFEYNNENICVYGNYSSLDSMTVNKLIKSDKLVIFFDSNLTDNERKNHSIYTNNAIIYYTSNNTRKCSQYLSTSANENDVKKNIKKFIDDKYKEINSNKFSTMSINTSSFKQIHSGDFTVEHNPYGFYKCMYTVDKNRVNDKSSLFCINTRIFFTPGILAKTQFKGYDNYKLDDMTVEIAAENAVFDIGPNDARIGGTPYLKDVFPVNTPKTIEITSSVTKGLTLGYSHNNGFSSDGLEINNGLNIGRNIEYSYAKTIKTTEPHLNVFPNPNNSNSFFWNMDYNSHSKDAYNIDIGYLFEKDNHEGDLRENDIMWKYNIDVNYYNFLSCKSIDGNDMYINFC